MVEVGGHRRPGEARRGFVLAGIGLWAILFLFASCDSRVSPASLISESAGSAAGLVPPSCDAPPTPDLYRALAEHRQDVLRLYAQNGWDPVTRCHAIYDNWLAHGPDGKPPTTSGHSWRQKAGFPPPSRPSPVPPKSFRGKEGRDQVGGC